MKKIIPYILAGIVWVSCMVSCNTGNMPLPLAQGREGEVLVIIDSYLWKGACGDSIRSCLTPAVMGLPAPEPMFTLIQQDALSGFMQKFRNIVVVRVDNGYEQAKLGYRNNTYAQDQLLFNIEAPSADSVIACFNKNRERIITQILEKDRESYTNYYRKIIAEPVVEKLREKFQADIVVPREYTLDVERDNFVWMAREEGERTMGILMWKDPYTAQSQMETEQLIARMNAVTKANVPGPTEGSYMADEPTVPPVVKRFSKDSIYCVQMNGLWQMENGFMGGPYVNMSMIDSKRGQIVTALGFVFYPNRDKRQFVRQLEAILHSMKPAGEKQPAGEEQND